MEWRFDGPDIGGAMDDPRFDVVTGGQTFDGYYNGNGVYIFRWCPKGVDEWSYKITSRHDFLDGKTGTFTSVPEGTLPTSVNRVRHSQWWTDQYTPELMEHGHFGIKTINRWRQDYLKHWQSRLDWLR